MNDRIPLTDFIKQHYKSIIYSAEEMKGFTEQQILQAKMGNTFRAARKAGYEVDVDFVPLFYDTLGLKNPE